MAASLRFFDSGLYSSLSFRPYFRRNLGSSRSESDFPATERKVLKLQGPRSSTVGFRVRCNLQESKNESSGEEPPESEFMKELRKRGMTPPTSLIEDSNRTLNGLEGDTNLKEDDGEFSSKMNLVSTEIEKSLSNQRERSIALNSEGLEGLIPRAKVLLTTGGTFFIGFWPLILITVAFFSALYFYFGPSFIHDASRTPIVPPPYIDPYALLEDDSISQTVHRVN
ncbi:hypothetical protein L1049_026082 [Liquidambar formosana]|uniref:Tubulin alpha-6 chain n=1 Tax=Liquidambar formosana TaxID=63359 RepID=A0AAP0NE53_LIQFO